MRQWLVTSEQPTHEKCLLEWKLKLVKCQKSFPVLPQMTLFACGRYYDDLSSQHIGTLWEALLSSLQTHSYIHSGQFSKATVLISTIFLISLFTWEAKVDLRLRVLDVPLASIMWLCAVCSPVHTKLHWLQLEMWTLAWLTVIMGQHSNIKLVPASEERRLNTFKSDNNSQHSHRRKTRKGKNQIPPSNIFWSTHGKVCNQTIIVLGCGWLGSFRGVG